MRNSGDDGDAVARGILLLGAVAVVAGIVAGVVAPSDAGAEQPIGGLIGGAVGTAVGLWAFGMLTIRVARHWLTSRRRKQRTVGTVVGRSTDQQPSDHTYVYQRVLSVSYRVGRRALSLDWAPSFFHSNDSARMARVDRKYPDGTEVVVHYDPARPENAAVGRAWFAPLLALLLLSAFAVGTGVMAFVVTGALVLAGRATTEAPPGDSVEL